MEQIKIYTEEKYKNKYWRNWLFVSSQNTSSSVRLDSDWIKSTDQDESFSANLIFHGRQSMPLTNLLDENSGTKGSAFRSFIFEEKLFPRRETRGFPHNTRQKQHSEILDCRRKHRGTTRYAPLASPRLNSRRVRKSRDFDSRIASNRSVGIGLAFESLARSCRFFPRHFFDLFVSPWTTTISTGVFIWWHVESRIKMMTIVKFFHGKCDVILIDIVEIIFSNSVNQFLRYLIFVLKLII